MIGISGCINGTPSAPRSCQWGTFETHKTKGISNATTRNVTGFWVIAPWAAVVLHNSNALHLLHPPALLIGNEFGVGPSGKPSIEANQVEILYVRTLKWIEF